MFLEYFNDEENSKPINKADLLLAISQRRTKLSNPLFHSTEDGLPTISYSRRVGVCGFFKHLFYTYDNTVLILASLNYMNEAALMLICSNTVNVF